MNTINKEVHNNFDILILAWIAWFTPHIFLTPNNKHVKEGWKDQLIFNAAKCSTIYAIPINLMTSTKDLNYTFCTAMTNFLTHLWNLRITFPKHDIDIHANNVKSCFRQLNHHPHVMRAFSFVINTILYLKCGLTFKSKFSPSNWEPIQLISEQLATALFNDNTLQEKHKHPLDKLWWDKQPGRLQAMAISSSN